MNALLSSTDLLRPGGTRISGQAAGGSLNPAADFAAKLETVLAGGDDAGASDDAEAKELPAIGGSDYGIYANVVVNGTVVASLSNSGCGLIANGYDVQLPLDGSGPKLARERAEAIAKQLGGRVQILSTAMSEAEWAKTGKVAGKIDMWAVEDGGASEDRSAVSSAAVDPLLLAQEGRE